MTSYNGINYKDTSLTYKVLTRIHGEPTYETLQQLVKELKANAMSVYSNLSGGNFGHLGLVISPASYGLLSTTAFTRPTHPGALNIPPGTSQHAARVLK